MSDGIPSESYHNNSFLPNQSKIDHYTIAGVLGRGGMGAVYRAIDERDGRVVALKILIDDNASSHARFEREARAVAKLHHPNIVPLIDLGIHENGNSYYCMPLIDGAVMNAWIYETKPSVKEMCAVMEKVCRALHHAHGLGIIH